MKPRAGEEILDMAGGTGDVAFRMARRGAQVTIADINADMLAVGEQRAKRRSTRRTDLEGRKCRATELFGCKLRCLHHRVRHQERDRHSRCAEASSPRAPTRRTFLLHGICIERLAWVLPASTMPGRRRTSFPRFGRIVADDEESYRYLVESIRRFPKPAAFRAMVEQAGFVRAGG